MCVRDSSHRVGVSLSKPHSFDNHGSTHALNSGGYWWAKRSLLMNLEMQTHNDAEGNGDSQTAAITPTTLNDSSSSTVTGLPGATTPIIHWKDRPLHEVRGVVLTAIAQMNAPAFLFQRNGRLVRIRRTEQAIRVESLNQDSLRHHVDQAATFVHLKTTAKRGEELIEGPPPSGCIRDLLAMADCPVQAFPVLTGFAEHPFFRADGTLIYQRGHDAETGVWYEPNDELAGVQVATHLSDKEIHSAKELLVSEWLGDFPFTEPADLANVLGFLLTAFVLEIINSPTPMLIVDAPAQGTGKTLLLVVMAMALTGRRLAPLGETKSEEELRKVILSALVESRSWILFDNLTGTLRSPALSAALTARSYSGRELGRTKLLTLPNRAIWSASANNLQLDADLARRVVWSRLDAKVEFPDQRHADSFRHPDILGWTKNNRTRLVSAILTLIRAWIDRGQPTSPHHKMGSFESWAATIGGILTVAGIDGFLANAEKKRRTKDESVGQWLIFCTKWWSKFNTAPVGAKELFDLVHPEGLLPGLIAAPNAQGQRQRLGHALVKVDGRCFGAFRITFVDLDHSGCKRYRLERRTSADASNTQELGESMPTNELESTAAAETMVQPRSVGGPGVMRSDE